ncbi:MAG: GTPase Era involved in 16S rRNA processing [Planctomycetota bacterium]|jgi:GTPase Era involved in 16S rRNA processing
MRTQLGTYCQQFDGTLRPVLQDLDLAIKALEAASDDTPSKSLHVPLLELQHQLRALCDKVAEQQAYVLIFGPLKSGKSTLMNAIAASYVSEVSSLPAYPCLVFVRAGKKREYVVKLYDGSTRTFTQPKELHDDIAKAHTELAQAIRDAENRGLQFDPAEHFPKAIRRVDVHVPDSQLQKTGAVLVDTPGLYTRMRFGYDRMTRDFRDAAACAIFVVKSDTLFLEQVFAEFQQLLDLFSRIFLVVNVDSHKRDVSPDGKLVPSLEQSRPEEVLKAFEQLAMSAPLQKAAKDGRVRMYPVDLLHAASNALSKEDKSKAPASFRAFEKDLSDYLASSEYLSAFLRDSLQRAEGLLTEMQSFFDHEDAKRLERRLAELDEDREWLKTEQKKVENALQLDWTESFARSHRDIIAEVERSARDHGAKLLRTLGASIDTWFLSSQSLQWLVQGQWSPLVKDYREACLEAAAKAFAQAGSQMDAGLDLPDGISELTRRAGVDLRVMRSHALDSLGPVAWPKHAVVPVDVRTIPVKKSVLDRISFRSLDKVRARVFGAFDKPDVKIPGRDKAKYLGEPGRLHLHQCVAQFRGALLPQTTESIGQHFGPSYMATAGKMLRNHLSDYAPRIAEKLASIESERTYLMSVASPLRDLSELTSGTKTQLNALASQFVREAEIIPQTKDVVLDPKAPKQPGKPGKMPQKHGKSNGSKSRTR